MIALLATGHGFVAQNPPSKFQEKNEFPTTLTEVIEEYKAQPKADIAKINDKLYEIMNDVLNDPQVQKFMSHADLRFKHIFDQIGFSNFDVSASFDPNFGPVNHLEVNLGYVNRPTLILIDKLHSVSLKFTINDRFFQSIKNYLELHRLDFEEGVKYAKDEEEALAELIHRIYLNYIDADNFDAMIESVEHDVKRLKKPINQWIDQETDKLADNNNILTYLAVFIRKLTTHFAIKVHKPGLFHDKNELFLKVNAHFILATGKLAMSWSEDSLSGEIDLSTRSGLVGILLNMINRSDNYGGINQKGVKETLFLSLKWLEYMTPKQQAEVTDRIKDSFIDLASEFKQDDQKDETHLD